MGHLYISEKMFAVLLFVLLVWSFGDPIHTVSDDTFLRLVFIFPFSLALKKSKQLASPKPVFWPWP